MSDYKKWAHLKTDEIELAEVSEFEKKRIKQHILGKKKAPRIRKWGLAAAILLGATITTGFAFPSIASQIPFVQNVMSYFSDDFTIYTTYDEFATTLDAIQTSNNSQMIIEKAVYDGTSITISYALKTEVDLGESPMISNNISIEGSSGTSGLGKLQKIDENIYVGLEKITPFFDKATPETVNIIWKPDQFQSTDLSTVLKGDWKFAFSLTRLDGDTQLVNEVIEKEGVTVYIREIERNDMTAVIYYDQRNAPEIVEKWEHSFVSFTAKDNLGNKYELQNNGGSGDELKLSFSDTMPAIADQATSLTLYPMLHFSFKEKEGWKIVEMDALEIQLN